MRWLAATLAPLRAPAIAGLIQAALALLRGAGLAAALAIGAGVALRAHPAGAPLSVLFCNSPPLPLP